MKPTESIDWLDVAVTFVFGMAMLELGSFLGIASYLLAHRP